MWVADWFQKVGPGEDAPRVVHVIVEITKGRRTKIEVDKKTGMMRMDRYLYASAMYPGDYGFIPQSLAEDGDPLDVLVMVNEPTFCGCLIEARPIGLFKMTDKGVNDFKILAVPHSDPIFAEYKDLGGVPPHYLREVEHFFATYKELEGQRVRTEGWQDVEAARQEIMGSLERYGREHSQDNGGKKGRGHVGHVMGRQRSSGGGAARGTTDRRRKKHGQ